MATQALSQPTSEPLPRRIEFYDGSDDNDSSTYTLKDPSGSILADLCMNYFAGCCGAVEFFELRDCFNDEPDTDNLKFLMDHALDAMSENRAYAIYTTIVTQKETIQVLKATGFKRVGKPILNPNSGNKVTMWVKSLH